MELHFSDEAKVKKLYVFDVPDVPGLWEAEEPIFFSFPGNLWFVAKKIGEEEWADWSIYLDLNEISPDIYEELKNPRYADILFSLPWESWVVEKKEDEMRTVKEVAAILHMHHNTIYKWIKENKIKAVKLSNSVRIPNSELRKIRKEGI